MILSAFLPCEDVHRAGEFASAAVDMNHLLVAVRSQEPPTFVEYERARRWSRVLGELDQLGRLADNWDNAGSVPPVEDALATAAELLGYYRGKGVSAPAYVAASPTGAVVIEWATRSEFIEAEIVSRDVVHWMYQSATGPIRHLEGRWVPGTGSDAAPAALPVDEPTDETVSAATSE